jgi:hypothetical protein
MYGKNSTIKSYSGYEVLDTSPQEGLTAVKIPWKQVAGSVSISRFEERQNSGEARLINLLSSKVTQAEISMRDALNAMLYGDGSGNGSKDLHGLGLIVESGTANGATWGTYGGIDRSDALNSWWRPQWTAGGNVLATTNLLISKMRTLYNNASRGNEHPDFAVCDQTLYETYESLLVTNERFTDATTGDAGFVNLKFKGLVLGYDEQIAPVLSPGSTTGPGGNLGYSAAGGIMYMLNSRYLEYVVDAETDLVNTEFIRPENQDAKVSQILLMANLVCSNCARQAVLDAVVYA